MKRLAIETGVAVLAALVVALSVAALVTNAGGGGALRALAALAMVILAFFSFVMAVIWAAIYFGAAWAVGRFGGRAIFGLRWVGAKTVWAETRVGEGMERFVARPFAAVAGAGASASAFLRHFSAGPVERLDMTHEVGGWRTFRNRLRGQAALPPTGEEPAARNERDMQPGPGVAA